METQASTNGFSGVMYESTRFGDPRMENEMNNKKGSDMESGIIEVSMKRLGQVSWAI